MKPPRTALPLPRYSERRWLTAGWAYYFHVPGWAKRAGCPMHTKALGPDLEVAIQRSKTVLLPAFDAWRSCDTKPASTQKPVVAAPGTLDWVFAEYRADRRYTKLAPKSRRNHENGLKLVGSYKLKDDTLLKDRRAGLIDTSVTDALYEALMPLMDDDGNLIGERRTTVNHATKSCRRAWSICARRNPGRLPHISRFAQMGLRSSDRETPTASIIISFRGYCYGAAEAAGAFEASLGAGNSPTRKTHEDRA